MRFFSIGLLMCSSLFFTGCSAKTVTEVGGGMELGGTASGGTAGFIVGTAGMLVKWAGQASIDEGWVDKKRAVEARTPGTIEFAGTKRMVFSKVCEDFFMDKFKEKLVVTEKTTSEQIKAAAKSTCADIDKMVADEKSIVVSTMSIHQLNMIYMPPAENGNFSIPVEINPFEDSCEAKLVEAGDKMKPLPIKEAAK